VLFIFNGHVLNQELEAIKARVREMEEEAEKLKEMQSDYEKQMNLSSSSIGTSLSLSIPMEYRIISSVMP
jgi:polyadenylate-binding protein 2